MTRELLGDTHAETLVTIGNLADVQARAVASRMYNARQKIVRTCVSAFDVTVARKQPPLFRIARGLLTFPSARGHVTATSAHGSGSKGSCRRLPKRSATVLQ